VEALVEVLPVFFLVLVLDLDFDLEDFDLEDLDFLEGRNRSFNAANEYSDSGAAIIVSQIMASER
jgi:hypothetical protein